MPADAKREPSGSPEPAAVTPPASPGSPVPSGPLSQSASHRLPLSAADQDFVRRLRWLTIIRAGVLTVLLGSLLALRAPAIEPLFDPDRRTLQLLIVATYLLTIVYALFLRHMRRGFQALAYVQLTLDVASSAIVVSVTGGTESLFMFLFSLTVLNGSTLLYRRGAATLALASTACIVLQVTREVTGWWMASGPVPDNQLPVVFLAGLANVTAVFIVALLAGFLSEQLRDAGQKLRTASADIEALKALNEHIITSIQSGLVSFTLDRRIIFFNPAAERLTGREAGDILLTDVELVFPDLPLGQGDSGSGQGRWEANYAHPDGERRVFGFASSPLLDQMGEQQGWILIFQDLTHLRQMEEQVRRSERFAAVGKMAAGIAHEIRNPLASMSGSIQMLGRSTALNATEQKLMRIVLRETDRLNKLVTEFLQFARPTPPQWSSVDVARLLSEVVSVAEHRTHTPERPGVRLTIEAGGDLRIIADAAQLKQVIWNLVNNAIEASPDGGTIRLRARPVAGPEGGTEGIEVKVEDEGTGMTDEVQRRLFDPFFTTKNTGSGLGLALALRIVEEHGGELAVRSALNRGSTFTLTLPADPRVTTLPTQTPDAPGRERSGSARATVPTATASPNPPVAQFTSSDFGQSAVAAAPSAPSERSPA